MTHQMCGIAAFLQQLWKKNPVWVKTGGLKSLDGPSLQSQPPGVDPGHEGSSEFETIRVEVQKSKRNLDGEHFGLT